MFCFQEKPSNYWGFFNYICYMEFRDKIFISHNPTDDDLDRIKEILNGIDLDEYLKDSFVYVNITKHETIEVMSFNDSLVYVASKELNLNNKMSIEYIIRSDEINQKFNELCYWENINDVKKFIIVLSEKITSKETIKEYADDPIYSDSYGRAIGHLVKKGIEDYLYLEDVDA